jgi:hypothetical protein
VMVGASPSVGEPELLARYSDAAVDRWPTDDDDGVVGDDVEHTKSGTCEQH